MEKTKLYIVRHTETIGNVEKRLTGRQDYQITKKGYNEIRALNKELENVKFDVAYSSKEKRTKKTIQDLANENKIEIKELEDLDEMYFGMYDGWKWEDINKIDSSIKKKQIITNQITGIDGQENSSQVANRMYKCITNICKENEGKTILICSHGVAIESFLRYIAHKPWKKSRKQFCQKNVAINELEYNNNSFKILKLADTKYVEKYNKDKPNIIYKDKIFNKNATTNIFGKKIISS